MHMWKWELQSVDRVMLMYPFSNYVQYMMSRKKTVIQGLNVYVKKHSSRTGAQVVSRNGFDSKRSQATNPNQQSQQKSLGLNLLLVLGAHGHRMPVACNAGVLVA